MDEILRGTEEEKKEQMEKEMLKVLRPDGLVNLSGENLKHLQKIQSGDSVAVPVKYTKSGSLSKTSKVASETDFDTLMRYAQKKVEEIHQKIADGEVAALPYRQGTETGCDYCKYRHICGFDLKVPGYHYRNLEKLSKEEAIQKMTAEVGTGLKQSEKSKKTGMAEKEEQPDKEKNSKEEQ